MRGLETVSAGPAQAKRHSVKDAIKNYKTYYRQPGLQIDARRLHASKRQTAELARPRPPPGRAPGNTTSSYELRPDLDSTKAAALGADRENGKSSGLQSVANLYMGICSKKVKPR